MSTRPDNEVIASAIEMSGGIILVAAQQLNVSRQTLHKWIKADEELQAARDDVREQTLDLCEAQLVSLIREKDREAIKFYLRCMGKARGWHDRVVVEGDPQKPVEHRHTHTIEVDPDTLTVEQLCQLEAIVSAAAAASSVANTD